MSNFWGAVQLFFPFVRHIDKVIVEIRNIFIANNAMFSQLFCNFA